MLFRDNISKYNFVPCLKHEVFVVEVAWDDWNTFIIVYQIVIEDRKPSKIASLVDISSVQMC